MIYPPLLHLACEADYRKHYENTYCRGIILTFDGIAVRFRRNQFEHCFFESMKRDEVKDQFSTKRAERMDWIKVALQDPDSERYQGWNKTKKCHDKSRRVAIVLGVYVVVIAITVIGFADFVTAYVADSTGKRGQMPTIDKIRQGPKWK
jgi:hypothetical protein